MIVVITCQEYDERSGRMKTMVSHGVDLYSGKNVCLPCVELMHLDCVYNSDMGEYVLKEYK